MGCGDCKDAKWSIYLTSVKNLDVIKEIMISRIGYTKFQTTLLLTEVNSKLDTPIFTGLHEEVIKMSDYFIKRGIDISMQKHTY